MKKIALLFVALPLSLQAQSKRSGDTTEVPSQRHTCTYQAEIAYWNLAQGNISPYLHDTVEYSQERRGKRYSKEYIPTKKATRKLSHLLHKGNIIFAGKYNSGYVFSVIILDPHEEGEILHIVKFGVDHFYQKIVSIEVSREFPTDK